MLCVHVADVETERGDVIEFQHSNMRREERESPETFYRRMAWVVSGLRRKRDRSRFFASLASAKNREPETADIFGAVEPDRAFAGMVSEPPAGLRSASGARLSVLAQTLR